MINEQIGSYDIFIGIMCRRFGTPTEVAGSGTEKERKNVQPRTKPDEQDIQILKNLWGQMDPDLRRSINVAYNENRRAGDGGIKTKDLFADFQTVAPKSPGAYVRSDPIRSASSTWCPWLSGCISSSIRRLGTQLPAGRMLTSADIFADIAKKRDWRIGSASPTA